jgi:hypothetical protein
MAVVDLVWYTDAIFLPQHLEGCRMALAIGSRWLGWQAFKVEAFNPQVCR